MSKLLTTGDIAENLQIDRDRVSYAIRKLGIEPKQKAGILNLYTNDAIGPIRKFIENLSKENEESLTQPPQ